MKKKPGHTPASTRSECTWLIHGTLLTQNTKREALRAHLCIEDGRIAKITRSLPRSFPRHARVIDCTNLVITPGFVQAHIHLCQTLFRNQADDLELLDWLSKKIWVMEAAHTEDTLHTSALYGIHELLRCGTTTILDMGTVRHTESIIRAVQKTGIRASVGKCLMDHPRTTPEYLREHSRDALEEAQALFRKWNGAENDRIRISYAPRFVISCTEHLLTEVARIAKEQNALIHTHASENLKEIQLVKELTHAENIEYLHQIKMTGNRLVLAHCIWLKPHEMRILQQTGTHVVHCPSSNLKLASGFARVPEMLEKKINVALGADGAPCNNNLNVFQEMRLAALMHKPASGPRSMRAQEVLDMATLGGARALQWGKDIGSIEVGKKADLAVLDLQAPENHLSPEGWNSKSPSPEALAASIVYSCQPEHVRFTLVDGRVVYDGKTVTGISRTQLLKKVRASQLEIAARVRKN